MDKPNEHERLEFQPDHDSESGIDSSLPEGGGDALAEPGGTVCNSGLVDLGGGWHNASLHSSNAPAAERADSVPRRLAPRATPQSSESSLLGPLWGMATRVGKPRRDVRWQVPRAKTARVVRVLALAWRLWQQWC